MPQDNNGIVLLAEDQPDQLETRCMMLRESGFTVEGFPDGAPLWERYQAMSAAGEKLLAVVTDGDMPDMNGARLIRLIRESDKTTPIVLVSGDPFPAVLQGMNVKYIPKAESGKLAQILNEAIAPPSQSSPSL